MPLPPLGSYDLHVDHAPNATMATAEGPLESGATYRGRYDAGQTDPYGIDRDTWMIVMPVPGPVAVTVMGTDSGRQVKLLDLSGVEIPGGF